MNRLKLLKERKAALANEMRELNEKRNFEEFNKKDEELRSLEADIKMEERLLELEKGKGKENNNENEDENREEKTLGVEIRKAITSGEEIDISNLEVRAVSGTSGVGDTNTANIAKTTFADYIIKELPEYSDLYKYCRQEPLSGKHTIPVQKTKVGKFVKMKELQNYAEKNVDYEPIELKAIKFGTLVVISDECVEDTGYDIEGDVEGQIKEGAAETIDELLIVGDDSEGIEGLNSFEKSNGSGEVVQATLNTITLDDIVNVYHSVPKKYRKNAVWVMADSTARDLSLIKDANGMPILKDSYNGSPFGELQTLYNRPVVINDNVDPLNKANGKSIFFGDLTKGLIVGPRKTITIKKSTEYGWIQDAIALKGAISLDIKRALDKAVGYFKNAAE